MDCLSINSCREQAMRVLLAVDGSPHSERAIDAVARRPWPTNTTVKILTVVHPSVPIIPDPAFAIAAIHEEQSLALWHSAPRLLERASDAIRQNTNATVITKILEGSPKHLIVEEAKEWGADLIVLGSHGYGRLARWTLGSVAGAVVANAPCSVQVVRAKDVTPGEESAA
jgi:nucleotide-binding universal stress UspA family protein